MMCTSWRSCTGTRDNSVTVADEARVSKRVHELAFVHMFHHIHLVSLELWLRIIFAPFFSNGPPARLTVTVTKARPAQAVKNSMSNSPCSDPVLGVWAAPPGTAQKTLGMAQA